LEFGCTRAWMSPAAWERFGRVQRRPTIGGRPVDIPSCSKAASTPAFGTWPASGSPCYRRVPQLGLIAYGDRCDAVRGSSTVRRSVDSRRLFAAAPTTTACPADVPQSVLVPVIPATCFAVLGISWPDELRQRPRTCRGQRVLAGHCLMTRPRLFPPSRVRRIAASSS